MRGARAPFVVALLVSCAVHLWLVEGFVPPPERRAARPPPSLDVTLTPPVRPTSSPPTPMASAPPTPVASARAAIPPPATRRPAVVARSEVPVESVSAPSPPIVAPTSPPPPEERTQDDPPRAAPAAPQPRAPETAPVLQDEASPPSIAPPPSESSAPRDAPLQDEAAPPRVAPGTRMVARAPETNATPTPTEPMSPPVPEPAPSAVSTAPPGTPAPTPTTSVAPAPTPLPSSVPAPAPSVSPTAPPTPSVVPVAPPAPLVPSPTPGAPVGPVAPAVAPPPTVRQSAAAALPGNFPARASLDYVMRIGETGVVVGRPHIEWEFSEGRYRLQSLTKLIGVARVVPNDTWVLKSEGTYSALGLRPRHFEISGRLKAGQTESVDIDWERNRIAFSPDGRVLPVADGTQDLLSFMFQFALRPPEAGGAAVYVTNARKLDLYRYEWVDEETLSLPIGKVRGEHIERLHKAGESSQELWIAPERFNLPLRVRFTFRAGLTIEMQAVRLDVR